jgi:hypothetical protein
MEQIYSVAQAAWNWLGVPDGMTPWDWLNSEGVVALLVLFFGLVFNRKVARLTENADHEADKRRREDLAEAIRSENDAIEAVEANAPGAVDPPRLEVGAPSPQPVVSEPKPAPEVNRLKFAAGTIVNAAKTYVDGRLSQQTDERKKRGYTYLSRKDYSARVIAAKEDKLISETQARLLLKLFHAWNPYRNGAAMVTPALIARLETLLEEVHAAGDQAKQDARERRTATSE